MLFAAEPNREFLKRLILDNFIGLEPTLSEIELFVVRDTPFREAHYKKVLQSLETSGEIVPLNAPATRRRGTYADNSLRFRFSDK